ncbi:MAG: transposase [Legionellales bacterium]|nr:transposase [Legionellales bacterium]
MKKSKLSESQIIAMLNEGAAGVLVNDLCRKYQISSASYYKLKSKYAGMNVSELKRLKELEAENRRLKTMYADISLEYKIVKEVLEKKYPELIDKN